MRSMCARPQASKRSKCCRSLMKAADRPNNCRPARRRNFETHRSDSRQLVGLCLHLKEGHKDFVALLDGLFERIWLQKFVRLFDCLLVQRIAQMNLAEIVP